MSHHPAYSMATLCAVGGVIGFARTRSVISLAAGIGIGAAFGVSGYLIQNNKDWGHEAAAATSYALLLSSLPRALRSHKPVPLVLSSAAILAAGYYSKKWYEEKNGV
ncbi:hypothetical protein H4R35_003784 [Dimargaris xerosporica]|nr:hypothetical protein H4R35_003784 [Dimargaris xerosporica]